MNNLLVPKYNRLLIFDGSHALHRNLAVPNNWEMQTSDGIRTGGIFGVLRTIVKELKYYNYYPIVVFDGGLSKRRLELYPNYKHTQDKLLEKQLLEESVQTKTEEQLLQEQFAKEYKQQREALKVLLPLFNIPVVCLDDWEGDDLIYILSKLSKDCVVVSDDKDLLQLIRDDNTGRCRVRRAMRDEFWDLDKLHEDRVDIKEYIACKAIVGDNSDNIPSACFQVGDKTAPGLYQLYEALCIKQGKPFPTTEEELTDVCKQLNQPKRKAYLNFNESQFLTNVALTDLQLVDSEIDDEIIEEINNIIENDFIIKDKNQELIETCMKNLEFKTFDSNYLYQRCYNIREVFNNITSMEETHKPEGLLF